MIPIARRNPNRAKKSLNSPRFRKPVDAKRVDSDNVGHESDESDESDMRFLNTGNNVESDK